MGELTSTEPQRKKSIFNSYWLILIAPLLAYPLMVNLRIFPFMAPNEEPKWTVLVACALWMGFAAAWLWFNVPHRFKQNLQRVQAILRQRPQNKSP